MSLFMDLVQYYFVARFADTVISVGQINMRFQINWKLSNFAHYTLSSTSNTKKTTEKNFLASKFLFVIFILLINVILAFQHYEY